MDQSEDGEQGEPLSKATVSWEHDRRSKAQSSEQKYKQHSSATDPPPRQVLSSSASTWLFWCCRSSIDNVTSEDRSEHSEAICLNDSQELKHWLKEILEELDARGLEDFHCYLQTAEETKDGFKPVKETCLEHADKSYTVDLMVRTYSTKTREVTEKILKKINSDKEKSLHDDDDDEVDKLDFSTAASENQLNSIRSQFVERVSEVILNQLLDDLVSDGVFNHLEKEEILQKNQTRANKARDVIDFVRNKGDKASWKMIVHLQNKDQNLSTQLGLLSGSSVLRGALAKCQRTLRFNLMERFQCVYEGIAKAGNTALLNDIYTELYITEGGTGDVNCEHEVRQIETTSRKPDGTDKKIRQEEIFQPPPGRKGKIRRVMTKGVAGIGKTVLTQKFTLDWAEEKSNQDIQLLFPFNFRELNGLKEENLSLVELVHEFFNEMTDICDLERFRVVFIFDGLDECRIPLDFSSTKIISDPRKPTSLGVLLTNLIRGKLLPSAHVWITTRPAAANQIPSDCIHLMTEVRGFNNPQKEEYFRKRFRDEQQSNRIISHIKTSRSLHIMCHIPVFCWITATVLESMMDTREERDLPKTLTEMYIHFLVVHAKRKNVKYHERTESDPHWNLENKEMIESLGKLAFEQLQKGNLIFYEEDLTECGIDIRKASVYSGVFTQIFREESRLYQNQVFCFVHLSVQEFLASLHVHLTFINSGVNLLENQKNMLESLVMSGEKYFYQTAVDKALQSPNGHLDLFLRFLLGLSLQNNQTLLRGLLKPKGRHTEDIQQTVAYIKQKINEYLSAEKSINLFHCLNELNDRSLVEEIQQSLSSGSLSTDQLSPAQWSALVFILLSSEKDLELFDLKKYSASEEALLRLLPVVKASKKAILSGCNLSERSCKSLSSLLISKSSSLTELDLGNNQLMDSGVIHLCARLEHSPSKLEIFRLNICHLSGRSCESLSSLLSSESSILTELDLSNNDLQDSGVRLLSVGMESPHCKLETLRLSGCLITEEGCTSLVSALRSNPSHLRQLDLSYNHPGKSAVKHFITALEDPNWRLETLRVEPAGEKWLKPGLRKYSTELTINTSTVNKNIKLSNNSRRMTFVEKVQSYPDHPDRFDEDCRQLLCKDHLPDRCYWEAEWTGNASLSVSYRGISRRGDKQDCVFGRNNQSWSLDCYDRGMYIVCHNDNQKLFSSSITDRIAVYLDCAAGTLTYYKIISGARLHIHTFSTTFTEPLYAGFRVWPNSSVTLC